MKTKNVVSRRLNLIVAGIGTTAALLLSGCGIGALAPASDPVSSGAVISGIVHGGQFAVYNATVNLYEAGYTGYGSAGTKLATATTNSTGNFQFTKNSGTGTPNGTTATWQCDSAHPSAQIYIVASGGNTQGTGTTTPNNTAAVFLAALGQCTTVSTGTTVVLNELNTAATVYALANYINPGTTAGTESIGTSSTTQGSTGLNNAVAGIVNLASNSSGSTSSISAPTYTGTNSTVTGVTVTATADEPKLVTVANTLAACVNSTAVASTQCVDLFANATPATASTTSQPSSTFTVAVDTLQAAYALATNPGLNGSFTACTTTPAATTKVACLYDLASATGAPFQTGMTSAPTDYSMNVIYTVSGTCSNTYPFILGPYHTAVDASGNIWVVNGGGSNTNLAEMSPTGQPLLCIGDLSNGRGMTIDMNGNVWASFNGVTSNGTTTSGIQVLPSGGSAFTNVPTPSGQQTYEMTSDGFGNVFYNLNASGGSVWELVNAANNTSTPPTPVSIASSFNGNTATTTQAYIQVDSKGRIWDATSTVQFMYGIYPTAASQGTVSSITTNGTTATFTTSAGPWASAVGAEVQISGLTTSTGQNFNFGTYTITAGTTTSFSVASTVATATVTDSGIAMLPGLSGASSGTSSYAFTANATPTASAYGMTIDSSGNLYQGTTCCGSAAPYRTPVKWYTSTSVNSGTATFANSGTTNFAGMNGVRAIVTDGAGNVFVGNEEPNGPTVDSSSNIEIVTGNWSINEFTTSGNSTATTFTALSPSGSTPATCSTTDGCTTLGGYFDSLGTTTATSGSGKITGLPFDMQVDPSGNLWVLQSGDATTTTDGVAVLEMVGGAVPVVTPLSVATKNGTLGTKP